MYEELLNQLPTMDEQALRQWQALHQRHVLGEPMSEAERATYQAGCEELDVTEEIEGDLPRQMQMQEQLEKEKTLLQQQREQIAQRKAEVAALKQQLEQATRKQHVSGT